MVVFKDENKSAEDMGRMRRDGRRGRGGRVRIEIAGRKKVSEDMEPRRTDGVARYGGVCGHFWRIQAYGWRIQEPALSFTCQLRYMFLSAFPVRFHGKDSVVVVGPLWQSNR